MRHHHEFPHESLRVEGALDLERTGRGLRPRRLPAWTRPQLPDGFFDLVVQATAGVRVVFRTEATAVELTVHATRVGIPGVGTVPASIDLVVTGERTRNEPVTGGDVLRLTSIDGEFVAVPGDAETLRFEGLPAGDKEIRLWLPQSASTDLVSLGTDAEIRPAAESTRRRWVHYGSSISHCVEADSPTGTWPAVAAAETGVDLTDLGFAGNAMLDPFVARTLRDLPADVISLKIGANIIEKATMRRRTFLPAVHGFLDTIRDGHPDTPIVVLSPIPCPAVEDLPGPTTRDPATGAPVVLGTAEDVRAGALSMSAARDILRQIVAERSETDPNLSYVDGRELLHPDETADLYDGVHPNAAAYRRMGARFAAIVGPALRG